MRLLRVVPLLLVACGGPTTDLPTDSDAVDDTRVDCLDDDPRRQAFFRDADGDGFGDPDDAVEDCQPPDGYLLDRTDCDDGDPAIHPDAEDVCDGLDNDCDGRPDEGSIGSDPACPAPHCRAIAADRDLPQTDLEEGLDLYWLEDEAGPYQTGCLVRSRSEAFTYVDLPLAHSRGWISAEILRLTEGGRAIEPTISADSLELRTMMTTDPGVCDRTIQRITLTLPFPSDAILFEYQGRFAGVDAVEAPWGAHAPETEACAHTVKFGVPDGPTPQPGGAWGDLFAEPVRWDGLIEEPGVDEVAWELHAEARPAAGGLAIPSFLEVEQVILLAR
jgi:hypothetical protein